MRKKPGEALDRINDVAGLPLIFGEAAAEAVRAAWAPRGSTAFALPAH